MAYDPKYGHVTLERGTVADDERVVVFRAQDELLPRLLASYWHLCKDAGVDEHHLDVIARTIEDVDQWQERHFTKLPDTTPEQVPLANGR